MYTRTFVPASPNSGIKTLLVPPAPWAETTAGGIATMAELGAYSVTTPDPVGQPLPMPAE